MRKHGTLLESFSQWWFGVEMKPKAKKRRKKRAKTNK